MRTSTNQLPVKERYESVIKHWQNNPMSRKEATEACTIYGLTRALPFFLNKTNKLIGVGKNGAKIIYKVVNEDTSRITDEVLRYASDYTKKCKQIRVKRMEKRITKEIKSQITQIKPVSLSSFTTKELIDELKRRGASGEINFKQTVKL